MKGNNLRVLNHLRWYGSITSLDAFQQYGITRLASCINRLRNMGYDIRTVMIDGENRYGDSCRYANYVLKGMKGESNGE